MPGEKTYLVLDENGQPLEPAGRAPGPDHVIAIDADAVVGRRVGVGRAGGRPAEGRPAAADLDRRDQEGTGGEGSAGETPEAP